MRDPEKEPFKLFIDNLNIYTHSSPLTVAHAIEVGTPRRVFLGPFKDYRDRYHELGFVNQAGDVHLYDYNRERDSRTLPIREVIPQLQQVGLIPGLIKYRSRGSVARVYHLFERKDDWLEATQELMEESKAQAILRYRRMYGDKAIVADFNIPDHHLLAQIDIPLDTSIRWLINKFIQIPVFNITELYDLSMVISTYFPD